MPPRLQTRAPATARMVSMAPIVPVLWFVAISCYTVVHGHTFANGMIRRALSSCIEHRLGLADECFNDDPNGYCGGNPGYPKSWCTDEYPWVIRECQAFCGFCSKFLALSYQNIIA